MIAVHRGGITSYSREEDKVPPGFVEGLNNKIGAIQSRADGFRDEEHLRLKILTCMLPQLEKVPTRVREERRKRYEPKAERRVSRCESPRQAVPIHL
jgi:hypothetical protein